MSKHRLLRWVRESQQYAAILAEAFLFVALVVSSIDASMGGALSNITAIKWSWAIVLALGLDTCFMASWVRCATCGRKALLWNIPLAIGMSVIVFLPVSIQMLQQSLDISFNQALANLDINSVLLAYARSFVAVLLGAILALTNVEHQGEQVRAPERAHDEQTSSNVVQFHARGEQEGEQGASTSVEDQIRELLGRAPTLSDSDIAAQVGCSRSTANKWKRRILA